jgi:hypothetical protein
MESMYRDKGVFHRQVLELTVATEMATASETSSSAVPRTRHPGLQSPGQSADRALPAFDVDGKVGRGAKSASLDLRAPVRHASVAPPDMEQSSANEPMVGYD